MRFFRDEAFLEEATARREAERGTFDPTYLVYSLGKLMMLKLRRDYKEQQGGKYSLRSVPRRRARAGQRAVLGHRRLLLGETVGRVAGVATRDAALRIPVRGLRTALRSDSEVLRSRRSGVHAVREGTGAAADVVAGDSVQGTGWYITDYSQKGKARQRVLEHVERPNVETSKSEQQRRRRRRQDGYAARQPPKPASSD